MREIAKAGVFDIPEKAYHADPCAHPSLTQSIAHILLTKSPWHAWHAHPKLNPNYEAEEGANFDRGKAAHALLLEGEDRMAVIPFDDYRKDAAKALREEARAAGRYPILAHQVPVIARMRDVALEAIRNCEDFGGITLADGKVEQTLVWQEGDEWCRGRLDWISHDRRLIFDYKSTDGSANPDAWTRTMLGLGGDVQGAFYVRGNARTGGPASSKFVFGVQETEPPHAMSFIGLPPAFMALGDVKVQRAIDEWRECMRSGSWPGYPHRICWIEPPSWSINQRVEAEQSRGYEYDPAKLFGRPPVREEDPITF